MQTNKTTPETRMERLIRRKGNTVPAGVLFNLMNRINTGRVAYTREG